MFDDNNISDYEIAYKILNELEDKYNCDLSATTYVIVNSIGTDSTSCNLAQLEEMYAANWEIASHTMSHPIMTMLSYSEIIYEFQVSKDSLIELGFNVSSFAFPYGVYNNELKIIASKYYTTVRSTKDSEWHFPLNTLDLGCFVVSEDNCIESIKRRVNLAILREENVIFLLFHKLKNLPGYVTEKEFYELTEYIILEYNLYPMSLQNFLNKQNRFNQNRFNIYWLF